MAARSAQAAQQGPQYSLPKLTAEEQYVQKKQGEHIQGDVRMLNQLNVETPFTDIRDALQRLLPFHLFNAVDAAEADLDDTPDHLVRQLPHVDHACSACAARQGNLLYGSSFQAVLQH
eukprot:gene9156-9324_t